ncbi:porin family protein [Enterovibrio sp. 27052020O]|uniref:porin family protein n=1 Tax=Enterovibrio sp. 27052020O TaxID=3241166 RepID=UPI00388E1DF6
MKKLLVALLLFSTHAFAENNFYAGVSASVFNDTELKYSGMKVDKNSDVGVNAFTGYSFSISPGMDLGVEVEYQHFGKAKFSRTESVEGEAFYVNVRPKFVELGNNLYSALIFGVGSMSSEITIGGQKFKDSDLSYQAGFEIGYMIDQLDIGIGYRYQTADFDAFNGLDVSNQGVVIGVRYNF